MKIEQNHNLASLNTFGISATAKFFAEVKSEEDIKRLFSEPVFRENPKFFLGGGSNVLFTKDFEGIVILNGIKGMEILKEDEEKSIVRAMSGVLWQDLVLFTVERGYWGLENLSLIPGTVGAAPMQNIGAYGAELKNVLQSVEAFDIETGEKKIFNKDECRLGYRDSIFKNELKNKYFISAVTMELSKIERKNTSYKVLAEYLEKNGIEVKGPRDISDAVSEIRRSKLPDPKLIGNAGSFFKNVFIKKDKLEELLTAYPDMPHFEEDGLIKVPAGWLIEQCGWKGKKIGKAGVYEKQSLVLVNHGGATGKEIVGIAESIIASIKEKFGVDLVPEVNIV